MALFSSADMLLLLSHTLPVGAVLAQCNKSARVCPLPRWRTSGTPEKLPVGEFRVSPRNVLCGVSLPGRATARVGVDERVEGAPGKPPGCILLDVDQVDYVAPVHPLVEPHGGVASFDDLNQAPGEADAVQTVSTVAVTSVDLHGDRLVHAFFLLGAKVRPGRREDAAAEPCCYRDPNTPT